MNQENNTLGNEKEQPDYNELFSTAVLTSTIVKIFAVIMIVSLVYQPELWLNPVTWFIGGGVVIVVFFVSYSLSLRLLRFGPGGTPAGLAYPVFSLFAVMVILLFTQHQMSFLNTLFFFPAVIATLMLGRRGMAAVPIAIAFLLGMDLYYGEQVSDWGVTDNLVTSVVLVFVAWLVGEATEVNRRANRELADNTHLLRTVLDALPAGVLTLSKKGETISVNRYLRTLIGIDKERTEQNLETIRQLFTSPETTFNTGEVRDADGRPVPVQVSRHPVTIRSGEADVIVVQNLTDRQKRRELDLLFRRLLAEWNLGVVFLDSDHRVRVYNEAAREYLGLEESLEGKHLIDILPERECGTAGCELVKDNRYLQVSSSSWSDTPDGRQWTVLTICDTTDQKKAELEMQRVRNLSSLGQIAAGVAHELRNPLTTIKGFAQLAVESTDPEKIKAHLTYVLQEIGRMQEILNRFLLMSKPAKPSYELLDLREIVFWIWDLIYNDSLSRQITLVRKLTDEKLMTRSDAQLLRQVVLNLVNNAFEATPAGGRVTVSCSADGERAVLAVQDTGCGIPPHLLDEIFVPFVTTKDSGTGLGLAISREIVHEHGGRLEVDSSAEGTTFRVILPRVNA